VNIEALNSVTPGCPGNISSAMPERQLAYGSLKICTGFSLLLREN
jgi:hypothetical protein